MTTIFAEGGADCIIDEETKRQAVRAAVEHLLDQRRLVDGP